MHELTETPRILITRLSAVGDCILTLPVLCALRSHFPKAIISWLTQPEWADVIAAHPDLDAVIRIRRMKGLSLRRPDRP